MKAKSQPINHLILPYAGIMAGLCLFAQIVTAARGSEIDFVAGLALVPACLYYFYFNINANDKLSKIRFGRLVAHFVAFLIVNLSFHIHAAIIVIQNGKEAQGSVYSLPEGWFGVLLGMFVIWGIGLLIHMIASIAQKGYEELDV